MDLDALHFRQVLDYAYSVLVEGGAGQVGLGKSMEAIDKVLTTAPWPDRQTWGEDPDAVEAQERMMALAGGPAPLRSKQEDQPKEQ